MKHFILKSVLMITLFCLASAYAGNKEAAVNDGKGSTENPYVIPRMTSEINIDGKLEENAWQEALVIDLPYETWPGENIEAPVRTEALLLYTKSHLYVGFKAYDPNPDAIRANYTERDQIYSDNYIAIFLDTFNDERRSFVLRSNPLGVQADDIIVTNVEHHGASWDAIYESQGQLTDWGYTVEMAIPFNQLRLTWIIPRLCFGIKRIWELDTRLV